MSEKQFKANFDMQDLYQIKLFNSVQRCGSRTSSSYTVDPFYISEFRMAQSSSFQDPKVHGIIMNWNQIIIEQEIEEIKVEL